MIEPETIIDGRYRVISRLGSGGMADVYLAHDQLLGRNVAVKVLHHHFAEDQEFVERFRREASSAAALSHPNIVGIFDRGEWDGTYYIAMEYVSGRSLKALVRERGPLDPATSIDIVVQILLAAQFAHRRGVIHRDLKPHNVILDDEGRVRVTDFGIARAGASDMTLTGSIMGTAQYLSPEQAQGFAVSDSSDLYSVGVILYELLTGVVPFEGDSAVAIAFKQVAAEPRPPSDLNPTLPPSLDAVVLRALAKDPAARYADAGELINALQTERAALPATAGAPPVSIEREQGATGAGPATSSLRMLPVPALAAEEEERRRRSWIYWTIAAVTLVAAIAVAAVLLTQSGKTVRVPNVVNSSEQAAAAKLTGAGLDPAPSLAASSSVEIGLVIRQSPSAGSSVEKGSHVTIVVSSGPESKALINVAGQKASKARSELVKAGFKPTQKLQASTGVAAGVVIGTEPPAGTELQVGSRVTLLVSSGPKVVKVPDLAGETLQAAEATLTNAELQLGTVTHRVSRQKAVETVLSQSPGTGSSAHAGDKVNLVVAEAPKQVEVPEVLGQTSTQAAAELGAAGFVPKTVNRTVGDEEQVGVVLEQKPAGGAGARKGTTVTIVVGQLATEPKTEPETETETPAKE
jgi:serine/threonine-protein kinase